MELARTSIISFPSIPKMFEMEVYMKNQQQDAPLEYYRAKFRELDPARAVKRAGVEYDAANARFVIDVLGFTIYAGWPGFELTPADSERCPAALYGFAMQILIARFLIEGAYATAQGRFKAYRKLPWGETYAANFEGRVIKRFAFSFGSKPDRFKDAAEALGGIKQGFGDISYDLPFMGGVVCRLILWTPEDDFPPAAQFLFSDNTPAAFNAEDLAAVGDVVISALKECSV